MAKSLKFEFVVPKIIFTYIESVVESFVNNKQIFKIKLKIDMKFRNKKPFILNDMLVYSDSIKWRVHKCGT